MKIKLLFFLSLLSIISCKDEEKESLKLISTWRLIETYSDPGDGSGVFQPVISNKILQFYDKNVVTSNGDLCTNAPESDESSIGSYSTVDSTITSSNCNEVEFKIRNNELILTYLCFEGCGAKFIQ